MKFTKMHGAGNDYVYVNCFEEQVADPSAVSVAVSDRHFGIGGDGLVLIKPSDIADCMMDMYNADGSRGEMCGNAVRCVAKFVYDNGIVDKKSISVETLSGIKYIDFDYDDGGRFTASVDMGEPVLDPQRIPVALDGDSVIDHAVNIAGGEYSMTCVSMGNPHCVVFVDDTDGFDVHGIGPLLENDKLFPSRVNTEFVQVIDKNTLKMRVWERGSGETMACGTGTCASVVASVLNGKCVRGECVTVHLLGGDLDITWREDGHVIMRGPAATVFSGEINI